MIASAANRQHEDNICTLCSSNSIKEFDRTTHMNREITYGICTDCGLVALTPKMSEEEAESFYRDHYRELYCGDYRPTQTVLNKQDQRSFHLAQCARAYLGSRKINLHLDVGCSAGRLMAAMQKTLSCQSKGIEPALGYREYANSQGFEAYGSYNELKAHVKSNSIDFVTISHVLEHLFHPVEYLKHLREELLHSESRILIEVPNLFGHVSYEMSHNYAFTRDTLVSTLNRAGFTVDWEKIHNMPISENGTRYISVFAKPDPSAMQKALPKPNVASIRWKRRVSMFKESPIVHQPRAIAGKIKRFFF